MKVRELVALLQAMPQEIEVAYQCFSEQVLMDAEEISVRSLSVARVDGWIQNSRHDMPTQDYVLFPGN